MALLAFAGADDWTNPGVPEIDLRGHTVHALTLPRVTTRPLPNHNYGPTFLSLTKLGLAEPHKPFRSTGSVELWKLTAAGRLRAQELVAEVELKPYRRARASGLNSGLTRALTF